ncbi:MAG: metal ABC transporter permease [Wigglesworthia glossinidia]|nr:metal ABC transporter permease [Wigglesworthia glossinidia]
MIDILVLGWISGVLLSLATGFLGSFLIWKKLSYFTDTLSHASLLGIALSIFLKINPMYSIVVVMLFLTILLIYIKFIYPYSVDILLSVISYSALSLGLVMSSIVQEGNSANIIHYLFGDLLLISYKDIFAIGFGVFLALITILYYWKSFLLISMHSELANIDGINVFKIQLILMLLIALIFGLSIKFIGAFTATSLFIVPSATARFYAKSPESMIIYSILLSIFSITSGLILSALYDIPSGPSVILCATLIFFISIFWKSRKFLI